MTGDKKKLFCFGFGYTAQHLAHRLVSKGFQIAGTTRTYERRDELREKGVEAYVFDQNQPITNIEQAFRDVTHILISVAPDADGDAAFMAHGEDLKYIPSLQWVGYLSATSVYGNHDGAYVSEKTEANPGSRRGSRRLLAEKQWLDLWYKDAVPVHIFRLAGIYGPGRSILETVKAGGARRIHKEGQYFSRIHVDDIALTLEQSMEYLNPGEVYNVTDDYPSSSSEMVEYACNLLNVDVPAIIPWDSSDLSPMATSFYKENKRIHNEKIKQDLNVQLQYPTYKEGLEAILKGIAF